MPGLEGTTLGRYRLLRRLGRGGMSEVYLARDERMNREVAIKVVSDNQADYVERFRREAAAIGRLRHEHVLPAFDYGEQGSWHYLVMPHIAHGTLRERLARGRLTLQEADEMLTQIADALQFAHDQGIIHRDIKPSNIHLRDDHYAYLADFGLAKAMEGAHEITQTGSLLGTPEYMAPELAQGPATTSSDIYALGVLLYQMVTGRVPFTAETPFAVYLKQLRDAPKSPMLFNPAILPRVEQVILRTLEKNPRRRFQTAQALALAYTEALNSPAPELSVHDSGEMPPLFELTPNLQQGQTAIPPLAPATPPPLRVPVSEGKLILPGNPIDAPSALPPLGQARQRSYSATDDAILPPLRSLGQVAREPDRPAPTPVYPVQRPPRVRRSRRRRVSRIVLASLIGVLLLLLIAALVALALNNSHLQQNQGATATAHANATVRIQGTQQARVTATAALPATVTSASPVLSDNLSSNTNGWQESGTCMFTNGAYHVLVQQADALQSCGGSPSTASATAFTNTAIQVDVSLLSGNNAGLTLRANGTQFYDFEITNQGTFFFRLDTGTGGGNTSVDLIKQTKSSAIVAGNQPNTLLVIANGSDFKLFINGSFVGESQDGSDASGQIGFVVGASAPTTSGEASFANLQVFQL